MSKMKASVQIGGFWQAIFAYLMTESASRTFSTRPTWKPSFQKCRWDRKRKIKSEIKSALSIIQPGSPSTNFRFERELRFVFWQNSRKRRLAMNFFIWLRRSNSMNTVCTNWWQMLSSLQSVHCRVSLSNPAFWRLILYSLFVWSFTIVLFGSKWSSSKVIFFLRFARSGTLYYCRCICELSLLW